MIIDNADDKSVLLEPFEDQEGYQVSLASYIPTQLGANQLLVLTTRDCDVARAIVDRFCHIQINPFSLEDSRALLSSRLGPERHKSGQGIDRLLDMLAYLPLAISQAAAFIRRNHITTSQYLKSIEESEDMLVKYLSQDLQDPRRPPGIPSSILGTWKISFDQIQSREPRAAQFLSVMAMLDGKSVPISLLTVQAQSTLESSMAKGTLLGYSLVKVETDGETFSMHPLVQQSIRHWLDQTKKKTEAALMALHAVVSCFPSGEYGTWLECEKLMPHVKAVLHEACLSNISLLERALILFRFSMYKNARGQQAEACKRARECYSIRNRILGDDHEETIHIKLLLTRILIAEGNWAEAKELIHSITNVGDKVLGKDHEFRQLNVAYLAHLLFDQGYPDEAELLYRKSIQLLESSMGPFHPTSLESKLGLACALSEQERYQEAENILKEVTEHNQQQCGERHPTSLKSMLVLAEVLANQGKFIQAEEMVRYVFSSREDALGKEHPLTVESLKALGIILVRQGKHKDGEAVVRKSLEYFERILGRGHLWTCRCRNDLVYCLHSSDQCEEAEKIIYQNLENSATLGTHHPQILKTKSYLAWARWNRGIIEEAEVFYREVLHSYKKVFGSAHAQTIHHLISLGETYLAQNRHNDALNLLNQLDGVDLEAPWHDCSRARIKEFKKRAMSDTYKMATKESGNPLKRPPPPPPPRALCPLPGVS